MSQDVGAPIQRDPDDQLDRIDPLQDRPAWMADAVPEIVTPAQRNTLFVATPGKGSAILPASITNLGDWARRHLKLSQYQTGMAIALLRDLQEIFLQE